MPRILPIFFFYLMFHSFTQAQDFSNKGKDFWMGYGYHQDMTGSNGQNMILYFTSDVAANVKVEIPALGWVRTYQVAANAVVESDTIPKSGSLDARLLTEGIYNTGIHVTSDKPIVAYTHIYNSTVSGVSLLFPVSTLGQDYYSLNFTQRSNTDNSNSWAFVVATEDNTAVEITPSAATLTHPAGTPFIVTLNQGQIYNLMGVTNFLTGSDLTGTRIRSVSAGPSGCKKIAVFSGSGRLMINCTADVKSSDNIIQQVFPKTAWGKKYLTVPTAALTNNYFRIAVSDPSTVVSIDGVKATNLINNFYYEILANTPTSIVSDKPVMVAQYITSTNDSNGPTCGNTNSSSGDPEMIYISPVEQTIDRITLNSTNHYNITSHFINVVIKTAAINSFTLDGGASVSSFKPHPKDAAYSYAVFSVAQGVHNLKADSGFNAIAYGYGVKESYGYNAGTNFRDLDQYITLQTQYATVNSPATCKNTPFQFKITLPYQPASLVWDFGNNANLTPNQSVTRNNPAADSSFVRDGRNLYVYKLPSVYKFTNLGTYTVKILAESSPGDGCNGQQELSYDIDVTDAPVADFTFNHTGCAADTTFFFDASNGNGKQISQLRWDFGDGTIDSVKNPHKAFATTNTYNTKLTAVNDIGCGDDTTKPVILAPQPVAKFLIPGATCTGNTVTFTDSSTIAFGSIVKWYWDFGNGQTLINTTNSPVTSSYNTEGTFTVSLQVENNSGCKSALFTRTLTTHSRPVVNFDMPGACLPAAIAKFSNLSTISDGTASSITWLWAFGDGGTSTDKDPVHTYTTAGPFSVNLTATSLYGCESDSAKSFSNIYPQPIAAFNYNPGSICFKDTARFTENSTAANSSVKSWYWNFGDGTGNTNQNPFKLYADTGSFIVSLYVTSSAGCVSDTVKESVNINALPSAAFAISASACEKKPVLISNQSVSKSGSIINWKWDFGNGTTAKYQNGNPFEIMAGGAGTYQVTLTVETDKGCKSDTATHPVEIVPNPVANFIMPEICVAEPFAAFTDSSYVPGGSTGALTYLWTFGDPGATAANPDTSIVKNPQHKYLSPGYYNVSLTTFSSAGCSSATIKQFTVNGYPSANFTVSDSTSLCSNKDVIIQNTSTADIGSVTRMEITWDLQNAPQTIFADENPMQGTLYSHLYSASLTPQVYQVKLKAYTGSCASEKIETVKVNPAPDAVFLPVSGVCSNAPAFTLSQARETTGIAGSALFSGSQVSPAGMFNPAIAGVGNNVVSYIFTSANGCIDSANQVVSVFPALAVTLSPQVKILEGGSAILNPVITGDAVIYKWTPPTYLNNSSIKNPSTSPLADVTYRLTATSSEGCSSFDDVTVSILHSLQIPNAFSPNGDGINDTWNIPSLDSYPDCTVEVFNRYGKIVFKSVGYSQPWAGTFNGSSLPEGVYYYIVNPKNGKNATSGSVTILK